MVNTVGKFIDKSPQKSMHNNRGNILIFMKRPVMFVIVVGSVDACAGSAVSETLLKFLEWTTSVVNVRKG